MAKDLAFFKTLLNGLTTKTDSDMRWDKLKDRPFYEEAGIIKKLDEKYVPDTIARKTDIPEVSSIESLISALTSNKADKDHIHEYTNYKKTVITLPGDHRSFKLAYGNGKYVAITTNGSYAAYSEDGINWTQTTMPKSAYWTSITYGNNMFVAVASSDAIAAYSYDGITWIETTMPGSYTWRAVTYGNGKFVVVGSGVGIKYSEDAINWYDATITDTAHLYNFTNVVYGNGMFVCICGDSIYAGYSEDGVTWRDTPAVQKLSWKLLSYGNGVFVAIGNSSNGMYSHDGITWNSMNMGSGSSWSSIAYGNGMFIATFRGSILTESTDGINWTKVTYGVQYTDVIDELVYGGGKFLGLYNNVRRVYLSYDGVTWDKYRHYLIQNNTNVDIEKLIPSTIARKTDIPEIPEIPTFDLTAMGLPAIAPGGTVVTCTTTTENIAKIHEAAMRGSIKLKFLVNVGMEVGMETVVNCLQLYGTGTVGGSFLVRNNDVTFLVSFTFDTDCTINAEALTLVTQ